MPLDIYWDSDFKVRSVIPQFIDAVGLSSPLNFAAGPYILEMETTTVLVSLWSEFGQTLNLDIEISYDGIVFETETVNVTLVHETKFELPVQGVKKIRISTPGLFSAQDISFILFNS
jgi:hypothetical protein